MLQKLSLKKRIVIVLVRTQEDLAKCDALIIPGGGESLCPPCSSFGVDGPLVCRVPARVNNDSAAGTLGGAAWTSSRVSQDKAGMGDVCWCDLTRAVY